MTQVPATAEEMVRLERDRQWSLRRQCTSREGIWWPNLAPAVPVSYPDEGHRAIAEVEDASYWFQHRNRAIARFLRDRGVDGALWDVGAGTGVVAAHLQSCGIEVVGVEPGPDGARIASDRGLHTVICGTLEQVGLPPASIGAVGLFDVIEHLEKPDALLREAAGILRPGGSLFVSVPAYQWLWSGADEAAGHFRRYTLGHLDREVLPHGFRRVRGQYLFHSLVLPVALGRTLPSMLGHRGDENLEATQAELAPTSPAVATALRAIFALEDMIDRWYPLPFGTSVLAAYERTR